MTKQLSFLQDAQKPLVLQEVEQEKILLFCPHALFFSNSIKVSTEAKVTWYQPRSRKFQPKIDGKNICEGVAFFFPEVRNEKHLKFSGMKEIQIPGTANSQRTLPEIFLFQNFKLCFSLKL